MIDHSNSDGEGFTLIEILIATTLSVMVIGVLVAVMVTSMNVASSTKDQLHDSTDLSLVSAWVYKDAQAAGGSDPTTAQLQPSIGASTTDDGGCVGPGSLVLRLSWIERPSLGSPSTYVATYRLAGNGTLTRRLCQDGATAADVELGYSVAAASATCSPACTGLPNTVSMTVRGGGTGAPLVTTLTASLRSQAPLSPTAANSSTVSLVALGDLGGPSPCPVVSLSGTNAVTVIGDAVVSSTCGGGSVADPLVQISPLAGGSLTTTRQLNDPFVALATPATTCPATGANPPIGSHDPDPDLYTVYPGPVSISGAATFAPGRYVFCNGLTIGSGAVVTDAGGVFFYVPAGPFSVSGDASIDLSSTTTGPYANVLVWVANGQAVTLQTGPAVAIASGFVYAPTSVVTVSSTGPNIATNIGGLVARTITFGDAGSLRFGAVPDISITPATLPVGDTAAAYGPVDLDVSGNVTSPIAWQAAGLPSGLTFDLTTGAISGTPSCSGAGPVVITALDATSAAAVQGYTLTVTAHPAVDDPGMTVRSTVNITATGSNPCAGPSSVDFQVKPSSAADIPANWSTICSDGAAPFTCSWVTPAGAADTYDLRAVATDSTTTTVSAVVSGVLADNLPPSAALVSPSPSDYLSGTATFTASAVDAETGINSVEFQYTPTDTSTWTSLCTGVEGAPGTYSCQQDTTAVTAGSYDVRVVVTDGAACASAAICPTTGNTAVSSATSVQIDNSSSSVTMAGMPSTISGTVSVQADVQSTLPFTIVFAAQPAGSPTWSDIACIPTVVGSIHTCQFDTTTVGDGAISFRTTVTESGPGATTLVATTASTVSNHPVTGYDVQTTNGSTVGRIARQDRITLSYSTTMTYSSIVSGWNGRSRTVYVRIRDGVAAGTGTATDDVVDVSKNTTFPAIGTTSSSAALGAVDLNSDFVTTAQRYVVFRATMSATTVNSRTVITIRLGNRVTGGNSGLVTSSVTRSMVWTPSASATDTLGTACSPLPVTESAPQDVDF